MIISEYVSCSGVCSKRVCDVIAGREEFSISIYEREPVDVGTGEAPDEYFISFSPSQGGLEGFVHDLHRSWDQLAGTGLYDIYVVYRYDGQCNLSFEPNILSMIGEMGLPLLVTCYCSDEPVLEQECGNGGQRGGDGGDVHPRGKE